VLFCCAKDGSRFSPACLQLRTLLGGGPPQLSHPIKGGAALAPADVVLAGTRAVDGPEAAYIQRAGLALADPGAPAAVVAALRATGCGWGSAADRRVVSPPASFIPGTLI
jgi:hypothetical protein